ncbi:MAG: hypothetical protein GXP27_00820 [Planctomycetes bacterium]|nr:hypothetical protein [Planctomycetota bacterium]
MATTVLRRPVRRLVDVRDEFGRAGRIVVTISESGIELRGHGTRRRLRVHWRAIALAATRPGHMPGRYLHDPLGWLVDGARVEG